MEPRGTKERAQSHRQTRLTRKTPGAGGCGAHGDAVILCKQAEELCIVLERKVPYAQIQHRQPLWEQQGSLSSPPHRPSWLPFWVWFLAGSLPGP